MKVVSLFVGLLFGSRALAVTYTGSLEYTPPAPAGNSDSIFAGGSKWSAKTITISWQITNVGTNNSLFPWLYSYTFDVNGAKSPIGHIIIECSPTFSLSDIQMNCGANLLSAGLQTVNVNNVGMKEDMFGIDFSPLTTSATTMTWSFYANRPPVWGDFYARAGGSGTANYAYNYNNTGGVQSGFLNPDGNTSTRDDIDPTNPASAGGCQYGYFYHILRPDTVIASIPEPSSAALLGLGGLLAMFRFRKK